MVRVAFSGVDLRSPTLSGSNENPNIAKWAMDGAHSITWANGRGPGRRRYYAFHADLHKSYYHKYSYFIVLTEYV